MRIVFMGTPDFAVPSLRALIDNGHDVPLVFTKPDKPKNRGHKIHETPIKEFASAHNIEVFQPTSLKKGEDGTKSLEMLKRINPDCIAVAAYGQILPQEVLEMPKYGCINVHASLLPLYRGAAPINHCIMSGEKESGISIMYMSQGIDEGDVILTESVEINDTMNATELYNNLSEMGGRLLITALDLLEKGIAPRVPQDNSKACYAPMITKDMCKIDWHCPARDIHNKIRGLSETPSAYTFYGGKRLKIYSSEVREQTDKARKPGTIIDKNDFTVACGDGNAVRLLNIQLEGGKRMDTKAFLLGRKLEHDMEEI